MSPSSSSTSWAQMKLSAAFSLHFTSLFTPVDFHIFSLTLALTFTSGDNDHHCSHHHRQHVITTRSAPKYGFRADMCFVPPFGVIGCTLDWPNGWKWLQRKAFRPFYTPVSSAPYLRCCCSRHAHNHTPTLRRYQDTLEVKVKVQERKCKQMTTTALARHQRRGMGSGWILPLPLPGGYFPQVLKAHLTSTSAFWKWRATVLDTCQVCGVVWTFLANDAWLCLCVWQVSLDSHHLLSSHFKVRLISFLVFDFTPNASTYGRGYVPLQWMEWNNLNSSGDFSRLSNVIASTQLPLLITCRKRKLCLCSNCLASLPTWHAEITLVHFCLLKR